MTAQEMAYQFKLQAQRVDTKSSQGLAIAQIIIYLNMGMRNLLMQRYGPNNNYRQTLESIQKRIDEWRRLVVAHEEIDAEEEAPDRYSFDLNSTNRKYLFLLRIAIYASKGDCENQKLRSDYSPSDSLDVDLDNPNARPNFEWRETLHRFSQDQILAYTDRTFIINKADIDYLRYPEKIDMEGYKHFDGSASKNVNCELPEFLHHDIVSEGVLAFELSLKKSGVESNIALKQLEE